MERRPELSELRLAREMVEFFGPVEAGVILAFCIWWGLTNPTVSRGHLETWITEQERKPEGLSRSVVYRRLVRLRDFTAHLRAKYEITLEPPEVAIGIARETAALPRERTSTEAT